MRAIKDVLSGITPADIEAAYKPHAQDPNDARFKLVRPFAGAIAAARLLTGRLQTLEPVRTETRNVIAAAPLSSGEFIEIGSYPVEQDFILETVIDKKAREVLIRLNLRGANKGSFTRMEVFLPTRGYGATEIKDLPDLEAYKLANEAMMLALDGKGRFKAFGFKTNEPKVIDSVLSTDKVHTSFLNGWDIRTGRTAFGVGVSYNKSGSLVIKILHGEKPVYVETPGESLRNQATSNTVGGLRQPGDIIVQAMSHLGLPTRV